MSVPDQNPINIYTGNGLATTFAYGFYLISAEDLLVLIDGVETVAYTVNGIGSQTGGAVIFSVAPADGARIVISRQMSLERETDYQPNGDLRSATLNSDLDRIWMALQDNNRDNVTSLKFPLDENVDGTLPNAAIRAFNILGFDELGNDTMLPIPAAVGAGDLKNEAWTDGVDFTAGTSDRVLLSRSYTTKANLGVVVMAGVAQDPATYSLSVDGSELIFDAVIPAFITRIWCYGGTTLSLNRPAEESVTDDSIAPNSKVANRLRIVYLDDYGAIGDGVFDNSAALTAADAAAGPGGIVVCTALSYYLGSLNLGTSNRIYHMYNSSFTGPGAASVKGNMLLFPNYGISVGRPFDWRVAHGQGSSLTVGDYVSFQQDDPGPTATVRVFPGKAITSPTQVAIEPFWIDSVNDLHSVGNGEDITSVLCGKSTEIDGSEERGGWIFKEWVSGVRYRHHQIASFATITGIARDIHAVLGGKRLQMWDAVNAKVVFDNANVPGTVSFGNTVIDVRNSPATTNLRIFAQAASGPIGISHMAGGTEDMRVTFDTNGISIGDGQAYSPGAKIDATVSGTTGSAAIFQASGNAYADEIEKIIAARAANSAFSFFTARANGVRQFNLRGDGNAFAAGSWSGGGADYAEYFEWADGNPANDDRVGLSVVLSDNMVRPALAGEDPIGVVSATAVVIGDAAWDGWSGRYERDDFGRLVMRAVDMLEWDEEIPEKVEIRDIVEEVPIVGDNGKPSVQSRTVPTRIVTEPARIEHRSYPADELPDGVVAPANATRTITYVPIHAASFDPSLPYSSRESRQEWTPIGLVGKLRIRKGQPTGSRWLKLRDISDEVEEWLVR